MGKKNYKKFIEEEFSNSDINYKPDFFGVLFFVLSMFVLYLSFVMYMLSLPLSVILLIISIIYLRKNNTLAVKSAICASSLALLVDLFIFIVNMYVY